VNGNHWLFVPDTINNTVSVIDLSTNTAGGQLTSTLVLSDKPEGMTLSSDGSTLYVANSGNGTISVLTRALMP